MRDVSPASSYCRKLGASVASVEYKIGQYAVTGAGWPARRGRCILIFVFLTGREISEWKCTAVPQVKASFVGDMKSFPIEYVTRHAPLTRVRGVHTRARTTDKYEKHGQRFEEEERDEPSRENDAKLLRFIFLRSRVLPKLRRATGKLRRKLAAICRRY